MSQRSHSILSTIASAGLALSTATAGMAESGGGGISIELNQTEEQEGGMCRLTFLAQSRLDANVEQLVIETVLFNRDGQVHALTLFDFEDLPSGKPRVRQFDLSGLACADLQQVLFNGVETCTVAGATDQECGVSLTVETRTEVEVAG
ncbi:hypothetical protein [Qingshengfaniella alkalisoli]|uniref:Tat pathway signal sequence domain protein n=1 Tax=Qingshengfaniella alkalisoli TaxID=2599296 RepID=A0A5B8IRN6_9RHOB|nr:hypothetical protein [Qingshengfaniella alkalisoli]QDY68234.1 hypothetical protein FPZ52_00415 [Qingshengfaniella alkalisoli]